MERHTGTGLLRKPDVTLPHRLAKSAAATDGVATPNAVVDELDRRTQPGPPPRSAADRVRRAAAVGFRPRHREPAPRERPLLRRRRAGGRHRPRPGHALVAADHQPAGDRHPRHPRQGDRRRPALPDAGEVGAGQRQRRPDFADGPGDQEQLHPRPRREARPLPGPLPRPGPGDRARRRPAVRAGFLVLPQAQPEHDRRGRGVPRRGRAARRLPLAHPRPAARAAQAGQPGQHGRPHGAVLHAGRARGLRGRRRDRPRRGRRPVLGAVLRQPAHPHRGAQLDHLAPGPARRAHQPAPAARSRELGPDAGIDLARARPVLQHHRRRHHHERA